MNTKYNISDKYEKHMQNYDARFFIVIILRFWLFTKTSAIEQLKFQYSVFLITQFL